MGYPNALDYANALSGALGAIDQGTLEQLSSEAPPVGLSIVAASELYRNATGVGPGGLNTMDTAFRVIDDVVGVLDNVYAVAGTLSEAAGLMEAANAIGTVSDLTGAITSALGVMGSVVTLVVDIFIAIFGEASGAGVCQNAGACHCAQEASLQACQGLIGKFMNVPMASSLHVSPADYFREAYFYSQIGKRTPDMAGAYITLCLPEAQGINPGRTSVPDDLWGIPTKTKRQMWACIKGIMANVRPPVAIAPAAQFDATLLADQGQLLWPVLNELVRQEVLRRGADTVAALFDDPRYPKTASYPLTTLLETKSGAWAERSCGGESHYRQCSVLDYGYNPIVAVDSAVKSWQQVLVQELIPHYASYIQERMEHNERVRTIMLGKDVESELHDRAVSAVTSAKNFILAREGSRPAARRSSPLRTAGAPRLSGAQKALLSAAGLSGSYLLYSGYKHLRRR